VTLVDFNAKGGALSFRFDGPEFGLFSAVLETYPAQDGTLRTICGNVDAEDLLEEALWEHREQLKKELRETLAKKTTRSEDLEGRESFTLQLSDGEVEWLLQVLNDIRVGHWVKLGRPDGGANAILAQPPSGEMLRSMTLIHLCTVWQGILLESIQTAARGEFPPMPPMPDEQDGVA
jgi:hypothetical protein